MRTWSEGTGWLLSIVVSIGLYSCLGKPTSHGQTPADTAEDGSRTGPDSTSDAPSVQDLPQPDLPEDAAGPEVTPDQAATDGPVLDAPVADSLPTDLEGTDSSTVPDSLPTDSTVDSNTPDLVVTDTGIPDTLQDGQGEVPCQPDCSGMECGDDGCGGTCGASCDDLNPCTADECIGGKCHHDPLEGACDDGSSCTDPDACTNGKCVGTPLSLEALIKAQCLCKSDQDCLPLEDGDLCNGTLSCQDAYWNGQPLGFSVCQVAVDSIPACDDGLYCNGQETCVPATGLCVAGIPPEPEDDGVDCTIQQCNEESDSFDAKPVDFLCDDGNACTDDKCSLLAGKCVYYPLTIECDDGNVCTSGDHCQDGDCTPGTPLSCDDGNDCTADSTCDPTNGCSHQPEPAGAPCGDLLQTACSNPDSCDGAGTCLANHATPNTVCRPSLDDCDVPELCDGAGACPDDAKADPGTACGDLGSSICTQPDSCDGLGSCLPNDEGTGTLCRPAVSDCDVDEFCDGLGACPPDGFAGPGVPCGSPDSTDCSAPDTCDGQGTCLPNDASNDTVCRPELNDCDVAEHCDGQGYCPDDLFLPLGTPCGSTADSACSKPDTCSDWGECLPNHSAPSVECRAAVGECDLPEKCDGQGACPTDKFKPKFTPCGSTGTSICDKPDICDGLGTCDPNFESTAKVCRPANGTCDAEEKCTSLGTCPGDSFVPNGQPCNDADPCTEPDLCNGKGACASPRVCWKDPASGLTWQYKPAGQPWVKKKAPCRTYYYNDQDTAAQYCDSLVLGGYTDWRIPKVADFRSLIRNCPSTATGGTCVCSDPYCQGCSASGCKGCTLDAGPSGGCYWPTEFSNGNCKDFFWLYYDPIVGSCYKMNNIFSGNKASFSSPSTCSNEGDQTTANVMCVR